MTVKYPKGTVVRCIETGTAFTKGKNYTLREDFYESSHKYASMRFVSDDLGSKTNGWGQCFFKVKPKRIRKPKVAPVSRETYAHSFTPGGIPEKAFQFASTVVVDGVVIKDRTGETKAVLGTQVGGTHYTDCAIQPITYIWANKLGFSEGSIVKYVTRWKTKGGIKDLKKAAHHANLLVEEAEAEEARTGIKYGL